MKDRSIYIIIGLIVVGVIALATGFERVPNPDWEGELAAPASGSESRKEMSVDGEGAEEAVITLDQPAGEMTVEGSDTAFAEATFDVRPGRWLPAFDYALDGDTGRLEVSQSGMEIRFGMGNVRNEWRVGLTRDLPVDLTVRRGAGTATLDLRDVDIASLTATLGAGETEIDLSGDRSRDISVSVEAGVGEIRLFVPAETPVRILAEKGIGEISADGMTRDGRYLVNAAYAKGGPVMDVKIAQGVGAVRITTR